MKRAAYGYVTTSGTLILTSPNVNVPTTSLRDEAFIFFTSHTLFNRVTLDRLDVHAPGLRELTRHWRYTKRMADEDFNSIAGVITHA